MSFLDLAAQSERMRNSGSKIEGATPLEGHLSLASLLVREAVQNSWDARDEARGDVPVHFEIQGWDLNEDEAEHLRKLLPVANLQGFRRTSESDQGTGTLHPQAVLNQQKLQLLVIADRRTVGLCGPTRSGRFWDPVRHGQPLPRGEQRFANFVRNSGRAAAQIGQGAGGAFGVGKNALWMASRCSTILIHSRTSDSNGQPVERFIGSIQGDFFNDGEFEYTGRHFVGARVDQDLIDPLEGSQAAEAVRHLPKPSYELDDGRAVDGTTIFIVAPRVPLGWEIEMERIRDSIRWQVWPKRVAGIRKETDIADMTFKLGWNNNPVEIPEPMDDPEIRPYAMALMDCARKRRSDDADRDHTVRCGRPEKELGDLKFRNGGLADENAFHLTLSRNELAESTKSMLTSDDVIESDVEAEPAVPFDAPWGQIALIRRGPLLLVRYEPIGSDDSVAEQVGVFLSADDGDVERALTAAEPAAHDDWIYEKIQPEKGDHRRTYAKLTVERIRTAKKKFAASIRGQAEGARGGGEEDVSRRISDGLLGGLGGGKKPPPPATPGTPTGGKPFAKLKLVSTEQVGETTVHEIDVSVEGIGDETVPVVLAAAGKGRDNTGSMPEIPGLATFEWQTPDGDLVTGDRLTTSANPNSRFVLRVSLHGQVRFRPKVSVMVTDHD